MCKSCVTYLLEESLIIIIWDNSSFVCCLILNDKHLYPTPTPLLLYHPFTFVLQIELRSFCSRHKLLKSDLYYFVLMFFSFLSIKILCLKTWSVFLRICMCMCVCIHVCMCTYVYVYIYIVCCLHYQLYFTFSVWWCVCIVLFNHHHHHHHHHHQFNVHFLPR